MTADSTRALLQVCGALATSQHARVTARGFAGGHKEACLNCQVSKAGDMHRSPASPSLPAVCLALGNFWKRTPSICPVVCKVICLRQGTGPDGQPRLVPPSRILHSRCVAAKNAHDCHRVTTRASFLRQKDSSAFRCS